MNTYFQQNPVMVSSGGGSNMGIPGYSQAIDGNLYCQIKTPGGLCLKAENRLPIVLKPKAPGKIEEIKYGMNCTIHTKSQGNSTVLLYVQMSTANIKKMRASLIIIMILLTGFLKAQYPFEKYPAMNYSKKCNWTVYDRWEKEKKLHWTMTFPDFFNTKDSLTVQLSSFGDKDTSYIRIFKNKTQIQLIKEPYSIGRNFGMLIDTVFFGDINGDSLLDLKILCWYGGCGTASLNERVIYLFQRPDNRFTKISYLDKSASTRLERDFDGDGNYEIITMTLTSFENHSYWLYNLYDFNLKGLINVNVKDDYPIMIQFLYRENYHVTDKISRRKMKDFALPLPEKYDKK